MRNCFIQGCDQFCKLNNCVQRKMFSAPKGLTERWREVLPKTRREFKEGDRVCERHFQKADIIEFWENMVNGKICRTKRDKPKLAENAIPSENLVVTEIVPQQALIIKKEKKVLTKVKVISDKILKRQDAENEIQQPERKKIKTEHVTEVNIGELFSNSQNENEPVDDETLELFEILYDEVNDICYPNTLWSSHRCCDRKFIVFSSFDIKTMSFNKYLYISDTLKCKVFNNGKVQTSSLEKTHCNSEYIGEWLDKIDKED